MPEGDMSPKTKPTINDLARVAGVSLATVDRVLNARPGVRRATIDKVNKAIADLGYVRDTAAANLARRRVYRLLFILPHAANEFVDALEEQVSIQGAQLSHQRTTLEARTVPPFDPQAITKMLDGLSPDEIDGVAVFGPETPTVRDAVNRARARGIAIVSLVADLPSSGRDHFVGIDNYAAGRTAARLMGRFINEPGPVLVITGSRLARDHLERRAGFDAVMTADFPSLEVLPSVEGRDDSGLIQELVPEILRAVPNLRGIYSSPAGNAGLLECLKNEPRGTELVVIAHELTPVSRQALQTGLFDAVISQNAGHLVRSAVRLLKATADCVPFDETQERIRIDIYLQDNMPPE